MVSFLATFPLIQSAIKVSGDGGMRIQLDIPDDQMDAAVQLLAMRGELLQVTVEVLHNNTQQHGEASMETGRERKSERRAAESTPANTRS